MRELRTVTGRAAVLDRNDVDTDQIIPKQFLKRIERTGFGQFVFFDWMKDPGFELRQPGYQGASILVAGRNFGCGSSREHAPWALQDYGFRAVVAPSFADIFYSNCTKIGLLPVVLAEDDVKALMAEGEAAIDLEAQDVEFAGRTISFDIDSDVKYRLTNGLDDIGMTFERAGDVDRYERERERPGPITTGL